MTIYTETLAEATFVTGRVLDVSWTPTITDGVREVLKATGEGLPCGNTKGHAIVAWNERMNLWEVDIEFF